MSPREKNLLIFFLLVAIALSGYFIAIPAIDQIQALRTEIPAREAIEERKKAQLSELEKLNAEYQQNRALVNEISAQLPSRKDIPNIVRQLEDMAGRSGLRFSGVSFSDGEMKREITITDNAISRLDLGISLSGSKSQLATYLGLVENNVRIMDVSSVSISNPIASDAQLGLRATVYYIK
jgi:Tfp pilus assembly protein PilO